MAEAPPPARSAPPTSEAMPGGAERVQSPASSDRTVVPPVRPEAMEPEPYTGKACFSTHLGRRPPRGLTGPPYPPVIVRGYANKIPCVVEFAGYWRSRYPRQAFCLFPNSSWSIEDLWDAVDIHLESPPFLQEVLKFMSQDNVYRAREFAVRWSEAHREELDKIGGDMTGVYDPEDHLAFVDKIFVHGETQQYPRPFLWHAAWMMRDSMYNVVKQQQTAKTAADVQPAAQVVSSNNDSGNVKLASSTVDHKPGVAVADNQSQPVPPSGRGPQPKPAARHPLPAHSAVPSTFGPRPGGTIPTRTPSYVASQPLRNAMNLPDEFATKESVAMLPAHMNGQLLRYPKGRSARSGSATSHQPTPHHGWVDTIRMPSDHRQPSGPMSAVHSPYYSPAMPIAPPVVNHLAQLSPNPTMVGPPMPHGHVPYSPGLQQGVMAPQTVPFSHFGMDPAFQSYHPGGPGPRGFLFGDMTNNVQYPPMRGMESRGSMARRSSQVHKQSGLYNPYGPERPEKADFATLPPQTNGRKAGRNSFSNNNARGRKFSGGSYNRPSYGQQYVDQGDNMMHNGNHNADMPYHRKFYTQANPSIVKDKEHGCGEDWIGPKNTVVCDLFVGELSDAATPEELRSFFHNKANAEVTEVDLKFNGSGSLHAFVHFPSAAEARKGLRLNRTALHGKALKVNVPRRHYMLQNNPMPPRDPQMSGSYAPSSQRISSHGSVTAKATGLYSPQDARSDLPLSAHQKKQQEYPETRGSPETRKAKKQGSFPKKPEIEHGDQPGNKNAEHNPALSDVVIQQDATTHDVLSAKMQSHTPEKPANTVEVAEPAEPVVTKESTSALPKTVGSPEAVHVQKVIEKVGSLEPPFTPTNQASTKTEAVAKAVPAGVQLSVGVSTAKIALSSSQVDSPTEPAEETSEAQATVVQTERIDRPDAEIASSSPRSQDESTSDDDQKHDLSFHSAQEAQSDTGKQEHTDEPMPIVDTTEAPAAPGASESTHSNVEVAAWEVVDHKHETAETAALTTQQEKPTEAPAGSAAQLEAAKKQGAKRTESLFPFAKPSKAQAKKEWEAKKKEKKKAKGKGTRSEPANAKSTEGMVPTSNVATGSTSKLENRPKTKEDEAVATVAIEISAGSDISEGEAKEIPLNATEDVTEGQQSLLARALNQEPLHVGSSTSSVQSSDKVSVDATAGATPPSGPIPVQPPKKVDETHAPVRKNAALDRIAIPNLNFLKRRSSPSSRESTLDAGSGSKPTSPGISSPAELTKDTTSGSTHDTITQYAASVASSSTLRGPSPPPMSASPTAADFYTPVQTPTALVAALSEATRKKNKKKKKKREPVKTADIPEEMPTQEHTIEPFHDQFKQIEGLASRISCHRPNPSYYDQRGQEQTPIPPPQGQEVDKAGTDANGGEAKLLAEGSVGDGSEGHLKKQEVEVIVDGRTYSESDPRVVDLKERTLQAPQQIHHHQA